jgi:hypothetical protein
MAQQRRRKREATSMALAAPDLEETKVEQGKGKREGRWGVPARGKAGGGEHRVRAAKTRPIYRPDMSVLAARYFLLPELT